jgi:hypothetical protein
MIKKTKTEKIRLDHDPGPKPTTEATPSRKEESPLLKRIATMTVSSRKRTNTAGKVARRNWKVARRNWCSMNGYRKITRDVIVEQRGR